uniref:Uncharacterized protein n=1 Tax=Parascaris univalens TaxID=6257 RepID=A0A915AF25_PARUN
MQASVICTANHDTLNADDADAHGGNSRALKFSQCSERIVRLWSCELKTELSGYDDGAVTNRHGRDQTSTSLVTAEISNRLEEPNE